MASEKTSLNSIFSVKIVSGNPSSLTLIPHPPFSSRYNNKVSVEKRVYKNLTLFMENKEGDDDLFDRLSVRENLRFYYLSIFFV